MKGILIAGAISVTAATACSAEQTEEPSVASSTTESSSAVTTSAVPKTATPSPTSAAPATTTPPGGRMNALFCQHTAYNGGPYYVQVFNPKQPPGMCTASERDFTQEEFQAVPGLKRRCILDRDEQIAQKHAIVSVYSDETPESAEAARIMCGSTGNEFIE